jgi:predicted nucleic acid-binding protein
MIVLDTNVISEMMRPYPDPTVWRWFMTTKRAELFTTAVNQAEIAIGIELLPDGKRRRALRVGAGRMFGLLKGRILPFEESSTEAFATIAATRSAHGRPISFADAQIAAIAVTHGATLATRNTADFELCDVDLINPWTAA